VIRHNHRTAVWTPECERRAIVEHVSYCRFCAALLSHSRKRRDRALLAAAEQLAADHTLADSEREAFARPAITDPATAQPLSSSTRMAVPGGDRR